jgi:EmrB/QacA subfamily drug resistance transporter
MTFAMNEAIARERRAALQAEAERARLRRAARQARRSRRPVRQRSPVRSIALASRSPRSGHRPTRAVLLATCAGAFLVSLDVSIANALLPSIGGTFRTSDRAALAWIITAYAIVYAAVLVPAGQLADRLGRRRVYRAGMGLLALGTAGCGLAPDLPLLIAGRVVQGIGAATVSPASMGLLLAAVNQQRRSTYAARWTGAAALGICAGPILGGTLTDVAGWRWAFLMPLAIIAIVFFADRGLPETPRLRSRAVSDPTGALLLATGTAAITFGISEAPHYTLTNSRIVAALVGGAALICLFVRRCTRTPAPLLDLRLLRQRNTALATLAIGLYASAFFGLLLTFVLYLVGPWQLSLLQAGLVILPMGLLVATMTLRLSQLAERVGFRLPLTVGATLMAVGLVAAVACGGPRYTPVWFLAELVIGVGIGLCYPLLTAAALVGLPASQLAAGAAVSHTARQIGAAVGIAAAVGVLGTAELPSLTRFHAAWLVAAGGCLLAAVTASAMRKA